LNKHKELRLFLKGDVPKKVPGEVTEYAGVKIDWIRGKRAVLTIFENGVKKEDVQLYALKTRAQMHELMENKGFRRKTAQEKMESIKSERIEEQIKKIENLSSSPSFFGGMMSVYGMALFVVVGLAFFVGNKKRKNTLRSTTAGNNSLVSRV